MVPPAWSSYSTGPLICVQYFLSPLTGIYLPAGVQFLISCLFCGLHYSSHAHSLIQANCHGMVVSTSTNVLWMVQQHQHRRTCNNMLADWLTEQKINHNTRSNKKYLPACLEKTAVTSALHLYHTVSATVNQHIQFNPNSQSNST